MVMLNKEEGNIHVIMFYKHLLKRTKIEIKIIKLINKGINMKCNTKVKAKAKLIENINKIIIK